MEDSPLKLTIYSWEITLIEENNHSKQSVFCLLIKLNIQKISSCLEETTNVVKSTEFTVFMMNVS